MIDGIIIKFMDQYYTIITSSPKLKMKTMILNTTHRGTKVHVGIMLLDSIVILMLTVPLQLVLIRHQENDSYYSNYEMKNHPN